MITTLSSTKPAPSLTRLASLVAGVLAFAMVSVATPAILQDRGRGRRCPRERGESRRPEPFLTVLGRDGADIVSSGDPVADASARNRVVEAYDAKHQVVMEGNDKAVLVIGREDWPFPIRSCARTAAGGSTPRPAAKRSSIAASAATSWTRSRPVLPMSTRSRNMPSGALPAMESTRNASSAGR